MVDLIDHRDVIRDVKFAPDASLRLLSASRDGTLKVWDLDDGGNMMRTLRVGAHWVYACVWSPDAKLACSVGHSKMVSGMSLVFSRPPMTGPLLPALFRRPPATRPLQLAPYSWPPTAGPLQLAPYSWPAAGPLPLAPTAGPLQLALTTGPLQLALTTGTLQLALTTGPLPLALTTGPLELALTTGSLQLALTTGPLQLALTTGSLQLALTTGPLQLALTTATYPVPFHYTLHEIAALPTTYYAYYPCDETVTIKSLSHQRPVSLVSRYQFMQHILFS